jgi:cellulose 1,4-beta-cellobiosidase
VYQSIVRTRRRLQRIVAGACALALLSNGLVAGMHANPVDAASQYCGQYDTASVAGGLYHVQTDKWDSSATMCISTDGNADFTVSQSALNNNGDAPGAYPSIYRGCHWGSCTANSGLPLQVSRMGNPTTSWSTSQPGSGTYDVAYDIWFNQTSYTSGQPNGLEMMIWLNSRGGVVPSNSKVGQVTLDGRTYNVWYKRTSSWNYVAYQMVNSTTSVSNLNIGTLARDAESRGYLNASWYLIDVEAGFEIWQGGTGLATTSFSVNP